MIEKSGTAFSRWARWALAVVVLACGATSLSAQQTTGKIEGNVADPNGQPVAGAQVAIVGTSFGALTNESGYYFVNNVPSGVYSLRAQFIGYQPAEVQQVRVLGGQTITVNFDLSSAVELGAISVTVASNPIVPRDQVSSRVILTGDLVSNLGSDNVRGVLSLTPGVVESGRVGGVAQLILRGGRPGEAAVFVDGALVRSVLGGGSNLNVGTNALEEAAITTGSIGAEFGDAQSGVISLNTRAGGQSFDGTLAYETDEMFGDAVSVGLNRVEASLSGPLTGNLTFSLAGTMQGQQSPFQGKGFDQVPVFVPGGADTVVTDVLADGNERDVSLPRWVQYSGECNAGDNFGFECQGRRAPYAWLSSATGQAKLQLTYGGGSRISLTGLYSQNQTRPWDAGDVNPLPITASNDAYAPQRWAGNRQWSNALILNWTQEVFRSAERALAFDVNLSYQTDKQIQGPLDRDYEINNRDPFGGFALSPMEFLWDFDHFSLDDPDDPRSVTSLNSQDDWDLLVDNKRTNQGTRTSLLNQTQFENTQPYRMNPFGMATGMNNEGIDEAITLNDESRLQGRINVDWQFDRFQRFKFGADYRTANVSRFNSGVIRQIFSDVFSEDPVSAGLYGQDRLDLGDVVIELGLRWDYFDTGALIPKDVARTFSNPDFDIDNTDPDNLYGVFRPVDSHTALSPRVLVSFPVTDRAGFRLSYSHQVQSPNLQAIMNGINNDISITNTNDIFATDVDFGKTIQFEFGVRYAFSQDMVLDVSAYNKDKVSDLSARTLPFFDPTKGDTSRFNVLTNADFGNVRGVDLNFTRRIGNFFNGTVTYTFQNAKNTGSDPLSYLRTLGRNISAITGERVDPPQAVLPTDDNRTHNIVGALSFTFPADFAPGTWYGSLLRDGGAFIGYRFTSGLPYTKLRNGGGGALAPFTNFGLASQREEPLNSSTMPWFKSLNLRLTKGFSFGATDWTLFADFRNILNLRNVTSLFAETGDVVNAEHRELIIDPAVQRIEQEAGALLVTTQDADGNTINAINLPSDCSGTNWDGGAVNCVLLKRAEARYGNGDGVYDENEYRTAFAAYYEIGWGEWRRLGAPRHIRLGFELRF